MADFEDYEKKLAEFEVACAKDLENFRAKLELEGLSEKTIRNHVSNMSFFLEEYLPREWVFSVDRGIIYADTFFDFCKRKMLCLSKTAVRSYASSLRKFYKVLLDEGRVTKTQYKEMKENMKRAADSCEAFLDAEFSSFFF